MDFPTNAHVFNSSGKVPNSANVPFLPLRLTTPTYKEFQAPLWWRFHNPPYTGHLSSFVCAFIYAFNEPLLL